MCNQLLAVVDSEWQLRVGIHFYADMGCRVDSGTVWRVLMTGLCLRDLMIGLDDFKLRDLYYSFINNIPVSNY